MEVPLVLQLKEAAGLKNVLEGLSDMFSEANFYFSDTGFEIQAVDTSRVTLFSLLLRPDADADAITHYRCHHNISMVLNLAKLAAVFRCARNNDKVTIKAEGSKTLSITFESEYAVSRRCLDVHDIDDMPLQIQELSESEYEAIISLPSAWFMRIFKRLSMCEEREDRDTVVTIPSPAVVVTITVDKEGVRFFAQGKDRTSQILCPPKEPTQIEMKEKVCLMFALWYIKSFSKVSAVSDQVTISLSSKKPAVFKCEITGIGNVICYMSPVPVDADKMQNE